MVEHSTIFIPSTAWYALWVLVHTLESSSVVAVVFCHEVAIVLESPGGWTLGFGREHQGCVSARSVTYCTRYVVVVDRCKRTVRVTIITYFIFGSINWTITLMPRSGPQVVWTLRQAEVVGSSSFVTVPAPSSPSCIDQLCSWCVRAGCSSPASVHYPSTAEARRSRWA